MSRAVASGFDQIELGLGIRFYSSARTLVGRLESGGRALLPMLFGSVLVESVPKRGNHVKIVAGSLNQTRCSPSLSRAKCEEDGEFA